MVKRIEHVVSTRLTRPGHIENCEKNDAIMNKINEKAHAKEKNQGGMVKRIEPVVYARLPGPLENCEKNDIFINKIDGKANEKENNDQGKRSKWSNPWLTLGYLDPLQKS